jgi:hypothetical protein
MAIITRGDNAISHVNYIFQFVIFNVVVGFYHSSNLLVPKFIGFINQNIFTTVRDDWSMEVYDLQFYNKIVAFNTFFYKVYNMQ